MSWKDPKPCVTCGALFNPKVYHAINCSHQCYKKYKKQKEFEYSQSRLTSKICLQCKKTFIANHRYKTCSKLCSAEWKKTKLRKPPVTKNCAVCNAEFSSIASAKTCSPKCSNRWKTIQQKKGLHKTNKEPKPCIECGKIFKPFNSRHLFCERKCAEKNRGKPIRELKCERCQKTFNTFNGNKKFCSEMCQQETKVQRAREQNWKRRNVPTGAIIKCAVCNFNFKQKHSRHIYCSPNCNADAQKKLSREIKYTKPKKPRICRFCKKDFFPSYVQSAARFCSQGCRNAHRAAYHAEKIEQQEELRKREEALHTKWDDSSIKLRDCPPDSAFQNEIWAYLKKGGAITKYVHPVWAVGSQVERDQEENLEI